MSQTSSKMKNGPLILLMINMFIAMVGMGLVLPLLPKFLEQLGGGGSEMGFLVAAFGITQFIFSPIGGELSDKYGRKKIIVFGIGVFALSQLIFAIATDMWMLYMSRLLAGLGAGIMSPAMMAYIADVTTEDDRAKGMGMFGAAMSLGIVIGPGIGGFLEGFGMRVPFYVATTLATLSTITSLFFLPETLSKEKQAEMRLTRSKREHIFKQMVSSFKAPYFMLLLLVFVLNFGLLNFETVFSIFLQQKFDYSVQDISVFFTFGALAGVIIQAVIFGRLVGKFGERKVMIGAFLLAAATMLAMTIIGTYAIIFTVTILFFIATSLVRPAVNTLLSKMAGPEQGFVAGMNNAYMSLGNIAGSIVAGLLFDLNMNLPYLLGSLVMVASIAMITSWSRSVSTRRSSAL
jgi:MFS transporter, DHA1 family, multidrug resistance protein